METTTQPHAPPESVPRRIGGMSYNLALFEARQKTLSQQRTTTLLILFGATLLLMVWMDLALKIKIVQTPIKFALVVPAFLNGMAWMLRAMDKYFAVLRGISASVVEKAFASGAFPEGEDILTEIQRVERTVRRERRLAAMTEVLVSFQLAFMALLLIFFWVGNF